MPLVLDQESRVELPEEARNLLGVKPGDEVDWRFEKGGIVLQAREGVSVLSEKDGLLVCTSKLEEGFDPQAFWEEQRAARVAEVRGVDEER